MSYCIHDQLPINERKVLEILQFNHLNKHSFEARLKLLVIYKVIFKQKNNWIEAS